MEVSIKPRVGRPKTAEPIDTTETIPVPTSMKDRIRELKNKGLEINGMTRDFWDQLIKQADAGKIDGIRTDKSA